MPVHYRVENNIGIVTLNRPPVNAYDPKLVGGFSLAVNRLRKNTDLRGAVLKAEGKHFSAGADVGYLADPEISRLEKADLCARKLRSALYLLREWERPVAAVIKGATIGGGLEIALAADGIYAMSNAKVGMPESATLDLFPAAGGIDFLFEKLGYDAQKTWEVLTREELYEVQEAYQAGIVDRILTAPVADHILIDWAGRRQNNDAEPSEVDWDFVNPESRSQEVIRELIFRLSRSDRPWQRSAITGIGVQLLEESYGDRRVLDKLKELAPKSK